MTNFKFHNVMNCDEYKLYRIVGTYADIEWFKGRGYRVTQYHLCGSVDHSNYFRTLKDAKAYAINLING